jgi:ZIP family zinc transporter
MQEKKIVAQPSLSFSVFVKKQAGWILSVSLLTYFLFTVRDQLFDQPGMHAALLGSGTAALATALGTIPVLLSQNFTQRTFDAFMGFGAGVMLGATAFSLVIPALESARDLHASALISSVIVGSGMGIGALFLLALNQYLKTQVKVSASLDHSQIVSRSVSLFALAIVAHNIPEGLAIGFAYAGVDVEKAHSLATGISLQDLPEGLIIAIALRAAGYGYLKATIMGAASGLVEPIAAFVGVHIVGVAFDALPWGLAIAAGAMLFVLVNDAIPQCHRNGNGMLSSCMIISGFSLMLVLDTGIT